MRVTESSLIGMAERGVSAARSRTAKAAQTLSSGAAVEKPSDDPAKWASAARSAAKLKYSEDRGTAIGRANDRLKDTDRSLSNIGDALARATELTTELTNGGMSAAERSAGAKEIRDLFETIYAAANEKSADGTYLFGGSVADRDPYDRTGTYSGDGETLKVEVAPGRRTESNLAGDMLATSSGNVLASLTRIAEALENNDAAGARAELGSLNEGISNIAGARSTAGARMSTLESADVAREGFETELIRQQQEDLAVDPIRAASEFAQSQVALEGARRAAEQIIAIATGG